MPLDPQTTFIPLALGLQSKVDPRALQPPELPLCQNAVFDLEGGIQVRRPYSVKSLNVVGGGAITDARRLATNGDELLLFAKEQLYSWSERDGAWAARGTYLAPEVTEQPSFARSDDQIFADVAELGGVRLVVWIERGSVDRIFIAATDTATGATLASPTPFSSLGSTATSPRVVAQATKFLVTWFDPGNNILWGKQITPATLAADIAGLSTPVDLGGVITANGVYDVASGFGGASTGDALLAIATTIPNYVAVRITDAGVVTRSTKARTANRIAITLRGDDAFAFVARYDGTNIRMDRLNAGTMADLTVNLNVGTPSNATVNHLTIGARTVADAEGGGSFRTFAIWSSGETSSSTTSTFTCEANYYSDPAAVIGTQRTLIRRMAVASRAFRRNGKVYLWLSFAGQSEASGMGIPLGFASQLQNSYFLYRGDEDASFTASPLAKAVSDRGGGLSTFSLLGEVQSLGGDVYQWAGIERRRLLLGVKQTGYSARAPRLVRTTFDSRVARRTVRLGRTLYVAGGLIMQYDGEGLTEVGLHQAPWAFSTVSIGGALAAGTYNHEPTWSWVNAQQEKERSTVVCASATAIIAAQRIEFDSASTPFLYVTHKKGARGAPALEWWRTIVNPAPGAAFNLVSSVDPSVLANPNRYLANDPSATFMPTFQDNLTDAELLKRESFPENGAVLASLPPPPASIIVATQDRLILGGLADSSTRVAYSKLRGADQVASFNGDLQYDLPSEGGRVTAIGFLNETKVVFCERSVWAVPGDGFDNVGGGQNFGPARLLSADVGALSQEGVALTPRGLLFKSAKGWYLQAGWQAPEYVGGAVAEFDSDTVVSVEVMTADQHVRILTESRMLVWNYEANRERGGIWSEWGIADGASSVVWQGRHVIVADSGDVLEESSVAGGVGLDLETAWIRMADIQGLQRIWQVIVLGELISACRLRVRLKRNYVESTYFDDIRHVPVGAFGGPLQVDHRPSIQQCQALKVRLTVIASATDDPPVGEGVRLTGLSLAYGVHRGLTRTAAGARL